MPFTGHVFFCVYQLLLAGLVRGGFGLSDAVFILMAL